MNVSFNLAYNEFELLVRNHFSNRYFNLDNNQLRTVFDDIQSGAFGEVVDNIYETVKSIMSEVYTAELLISELLEDELSSAIEWLVQEDKYDKSIYITQDEFDDLDEDEQEQNTLAILEDADKATIISIIEENDLESELIDFFKNWKDIFDFEGDYRWIRN